MQRARRGQAADDADLLNEVVMSERSDSDGDHGLLLTALPDPLLVHSLNY
jgi:hypothetical protein